MPPPSRKTTTQYIYTKLISIIVKKDKEHFKMEESKGFEPLWHPNIFLKNITFVQLGQLSKMQKEQYNI